MFWGLPINVATLPVLAEVASASKNGSGVTFDKAEGHKADEAEFIMLRDGRIAFEGTADELRETAARDPYIHAFLS